MKYTAIKIAEAVGGTLLSGDGCSVITGASQDSRTAGKGDIFFPIIGERLDGHQFIAGAIANGCNCFVISDGEAEEMLLDGAVKGPNGELVMAPEDVIVIRVGDTTKALSDLARDRLGQLGATVIGVTGSTGKTSTRDMTAKVMSAKYQVGQTEGNLNTLIGQSLTILGFSDDVNMAVLEMGMDHIGEIDSMVQVAPPHVALMTNIGVAHMELLGSRDAIFKAKMEIAGKMTEEDTLIVNAGEYLTRDNLPGPYRVLTTGTDEDCDKIIEDTEETADSVRFTYHNGETKTKVFLPVPGVHNAYNAALALAAGEVMGILPEDGAARLAELTLTGSRLRKVEKAGITFIDDTYNANPDSMRAGLSVLARSAGRTFAVLADMRELGKVSKEMHEMIGRLARELAIDKLFVYGEEAKALAQAAGDIACYYEDPEEIPQDLADILQEGDTVLFKGSHSMEVDKVLAKLLETL